MAQVIYLVGRDLFLAGRNSGAFVDDPKGIAPAWYPGSLNPPAPPGPIYINTNAG